MQNVPTIEEFWAAFTKSQIEAAKRREEWERELAEVRKEWKREMAESRKEWERELAESQRIVKSVSRQMGDLHNRFGELAEHLVAPGILKRFNERGYHFGGIIAERVQVMDSSGRLLTEIDLLLENGQYSMAVEVKSRPREKDAEHHVKRLEILREHKNRQNDRRKIHGAIAGAVFPREAMAAALEAGLYVIVQSGDTMKLDIPEGFQPREW
jgi:hypothetical protein